MRDDHSLRIALALETSGPGGAENVVLALARKLRELNHAPTLATMSVGWMTERAQLEGFPLHVAPQKPGIDLGWVLRFARFLRRQGFEILHTHDFDMTVFGGAAALLARVPVVATIHGRHWVGERSRRVFAMRALNRLGARIVAVSEDLADFLCQVLGLARDRITVLHNGVPIPQSVPPADRAGRRGEARKALGIPTEGSLAVAVGNLYPVKDHATLVRALALLPGLRLAIAGRGEEEQRLRRLAAELGVLDRLHLLGLQDDVERVLAAAEIFVQPSRSEGLPLALLEAMAAGLPVVATRVGGMPEAIQEGETGRLVPAADPEALAMALQDVVGNPDLQAALGRAARPRAASEFSVETMAARYLELYRQLREAHGSPCSKS